jgi:RND family efflux transporter MFP subunit
MSSSWINVLLSLAIGAATVLRARFAPHAATLFDGNARGDVRGPMRLALAAGAFVLTSSAVALAVFVKRPAPLAAPSQVEFKVDGDSIDVSAKAVARMGIETGKVETRDEPVRLRLTARTGLDMEHVTHVHTQFPGRIMDVGPQLGSIVHGPETAGGDPTTLCVIESIDLTSAKSDYLKFKVQLALDDDTLRRTQELVATKVLGEKALLDAQSTVKKDNADLEAARQKLLVFGLTDSDVAKIEKQQGRERESYDIQSPCSGTITEKNVTRGEVADTSLNLFTIADTSRLWVWGDVYERDWQRVHVGQRMSVVLAAFPNLPLESRVDFVSPSLDPTTRSIRIRGTLDNREGRLLSDMYGTMSVTVDDGRNSIVIPSSSVVHKLEASYVFVQVSTSGLGTRYERRPVAAETVDESRMRVTSGLKVGETVVQRGALALFDEMRR